MSAERPTPAGEESPGAAGSPDPPSTGPDTPAPSGPDLARAALARAKAAARARGVSPGRRPARRAAAPLAGSGPDARDPVRLGTAVQRLVAERGWQDTTANAVVLARWESLVGPEIADHCQPVSLVDGELVLIAESSAWATQLRMLTQTLQSRLTAQVGEGVVTAIVVRGPAQPDWRKGPRRVQGRGPRDTYG